MTAYETLQNNPNAVSRIAFGMTVIKGEIVSMHDVRFDGDFEGKITVKGRIIIGSTSHIKGEIICDNLDVSGDFEGTVRVEDTLTLKAGSSVRGEFLMRRFTVESGSVFEGVTKMISEDAQKN